MGCSGSKLDVETAPEDDRETNKNVERALEEAKHEESKHYKLLLLGAGEAGKSTVYKQVKMIYKGGMTDRERQEYAVGIRRNALECIQTILEAMTEFGYQCSNAENLAYVNELMDIDPESDLTLDLAEKIGSLWSDEAVQQTYERRDEFWCLDAAPYYFQEILRIATDDYQPTEEDMIMTRVLTTGIVTIQFEEPPLTYTLVDVGGQRSERRKWIHCFDDVKAIIFLVSLAGYNQVLYEDTGMNRMHESLNLFREVVKNKIFKDTPIFLFLNKKDIFHDMIQRTSLSHCFPDYNGPDQDEGAAIDFIVQKYRDCLHEFCPGKDINIHVVAARVRMDMKIAFNDVKDQIKALN